MTLFCGLVLIAMSLGCRVTAPIHVWQPPTVELPQGCRVALTPIAGRADLAQSIEQALLAQRPAARADVALYTANQLAHASPIRLTSTAPLTSDLTALHAARALGADVLLQGEILSSKLDRVVDEPKPETTNYNALFFQRSEKQEIKDESLLLSWRVIDVQSGKALGSRTFSINNRQAAERYPDLELLQSSGTSIIIPASARETWKSISPIVAKDRVQLAVPWFQPGAIDVNRGVLAARKGQWQTAEQYWSQVADRYSFSAAAHHNLAVAKAAREDFSGAKQQLSGATGPLAFRLPSETLYWLDRQHRIYNESHRISKPTEGWAFPDPGSSSDLPRAEPIDIASLPWWTAIPLTKPPGWSWQGWLTQPWVF